MSKVIFEMSVSLDGDVTGPDVRPEEPMGDGGERLHEWMFAGKSQAEVDTFETEHYSEIGALIMGRRMADAVRTLPRLLMIALNATIVNVVPPSIQEHLGHSRTRVAVGCAGSMP
jgi:dihydrofolate reductase